MNTRTGPKTRHLGRGLEALLGPTTQPLVPEDLPKTEEPPPGTPTAQPKDDPVLRVPVVDITPNPHQARTFWDQPKLQELADSIKANGIVQPIVLRKTGLGYQIIAGERRFRACQMLGMSEVPAFIRDATDEQMFELALVENLHRADLNPIERAKAYQAYIAKFSITQSQAAQRLGEDRSVIANHMRLLDLPGEIHEMLVDGRLSMGHARAILGLPTDELRRKLANRAYSGRLSVREVERLVNQHLDQSGVAGNPEKAKSPHIVELETKLSRELGSRVKIETRRNGQRGKFIIEFGSIDEFDRVMERLGISCSDDL